MSIGYILRRALRWVTVALGLIMAGIVAAALVGFVVEYRRQHWLPGDRWVGLGAYTVFGFGVIASDFRSQLRERRFWLYFGSLLAAHVTAYAVLLSRLEEWRLIWFLPVSLAEFPMIAHIMDLKMGRYDSLMRVRR